MRLFRLLNSHGPVLVLVLVASATTLMAQKGNSKPGGTSSPGIVPPPALTPSAGSPFPFLIPVDDGCRDLSPCDGRRKRLLNEQPDCFKWPFNPLAGSTVSLARLAVPAKAKKEFNEACGLAANQYAKAEAHLHKAAEYYPKYGEAWMLLGQLQIEQNKRAEAGQSCQHALDSDPDYLAPYVCLAMLAVKDERWDVVRELTNRALERRPVKAPGAYYYNSLANLHLHQLPAAEKSAQRAIQESGHDQLPEVHYLLARIFEAKKDRVSEANEIRQYLKLAPHASDAVLMRNVLRQIEQQDPGSTAALAPKTDVERK
jgi:tetratricopeptide (TPR) repeat protein